MILNNLDFANKFLEIVLKSSLGGIVQNMAQLLNYLLLILKIQTGYLLLMFYLTRVIFLMLLNKIHILST